VIFVIGFLALFGAAGVAAVGLVWSGHDSRSLLSRKEWQLCAKLVGIVLLLLVLIQLEIAAALPAGQFIYGRF